MAENLAYPLFLFAFYFSYKSFKEKKYRLLSENSKTVNNELVVLAEEFIKFGGYPAIVLEKTEEKKQAYLFQIINTYIKKDIRDIGKIRNISSFNKLLELLASQSSHLLNVSEVADTLAINRESALNYLDLLEKTFIIKTFYSLMMSFQPAQLYVREHTHCSMLAHKKYGDVFLRKINDNFIC